MKFTIAYSGGVPVHFFEGEKSKASFDVLVEGGQLAGYDYLEIKEFPDYSALVAHLEEHDENSNVHGD
jgi:hypothetical protein